MKVGRVGLNQPLRESSEIPVDLNQFKQVMRRFATGVMILTVGNGHEMHAMTVNAVTSVSLDPLLMLVCIEQNARSHELVQKAGAFALNILTAEQQELGERFAYDREARSHPESLVKGHTEITGGLIFDDTLGYLECRVTAEHPGGDHTIFVAEVIKAQLGNSPSAPLLYYGGKWVSLESGK